MSNYGTFHQDKQTQTTEYYHSFDILSESIHTDFSINKDNNNIHHNKNSFFNHLNFANQSYLEHFRDAISYSGQSIKAGLFFFIHALWPDLFTQSGSQCVHELSETIRLKYNKRMEELNESKPHDSHIEI